MVRAIVPSLVASSLVALSAGAFLSAVPGCVGTGAKASDDAPLTPGSQRAARSAELDERDDVRSRLPSEADTPRSKSGTNRAPVEARADADEPLDLGTTEGIQAELAQSADQLSARLEAALRKEATAKRAAADAERTGAATSGANKSAVPATPSAGNSTLQSNATSTSALPTDPKALAEAIVSGLRSGSTADSRPVVTALLAAARAIDHPDAAFDVSAFPALTADERNLVVAFRESCAAIGREARNRPSVTPVVAAAPAQTNVEASSTPPLPAKKPMTLPRFELATRVDGFGKLTPVNDRRFLPGKPTQVILYVEVAEFESERDERVSEWVTSLASRVAIYAKHDGTEVWSREWQAVTDRSAVKRAEFFICEKVTLSEYLTVGTYVMKASVRDEKTGALAEKSVEFQVVADPTLAVK